MTSIATTFALSGLRYLWRLIDMALTSFVNGLSWFMIFCIAAFVMNSEFRRCIDEHASRVPATQSAETMWEAEVER